MCVYIFTGYFWHIDSLHYDANFTLTGDKNNCKLIRSTVPNSRTIFRQKYVWNLQIAGRMLAPHPCYFRTGSLVTTVATPLLTWSSQFFSSWKPRWETEWILYSGLGEWIIYIAQLNNCVLCSAERMISGQPVSCSCSLLSRNDLLTMHVGVLFWDCLTCKTTGLIRRASIGI